MTEPSFEPMGRGQGFALDQRKAARVAKAKLRRAKRERRRIERNRRNGERVRIQARGVDVRAVGQNTSERNEIK